MVKKRMEKVRFMSDKTIKAVHDDDLSRLLMSLGVYDSFIEGDSTCFFCGKHINEDDIFAIFPVDENIEFCCNDAECKLSLMGLKEKEDEVVAGV